MNEPSPERRPTAAARIGVWLNLGAAAFIAIGWAVIWLVATFLPGGHPPLSAYVGMVVLLVSLAVSPAGLIAYGILKLRRQPGVGVMRRLAHAAAILNLVFWALAIHHLFLRR